MNRYASVSRVLFFRVALIRGSVATPTTAAEVRGNKQDASLWQQERQVDDVDVLINK